MYQSIVTGGWVSIRSVSSSQNYSKTKAIKIFFKVTKDPYTRQASLNADIIDNSLVVLVVVVGVVVLVVVVSLSSNFY